MNIETYHNVTAMTHQARVDELGPQGFRPISLSVSGPPSDARYAAVWVQRPGPAWVAVHNLDANQYQARFNELADQGFAPILVTATGGYNDATFAAVFEAGVTTPWYARHHLRWDPSARINSVNFENQRAIDQGYIPCCLAVYGTSSDPLFAGVWVKNDKPVPWGWWWTDPTTYQHFFDAAVEAGTRLAYVSVAPSQWMLSVFRDEPIGEWWAKHGMTASNYQTEFNARTAQGLEPLVVQAGGTGKSSRYASLFVRDEIPLARHWSVTGQSFTNYAEMDAVIQRFMMAHAIRAMSIAVARNGILVANRGYTWAEAGYPITLPNTLFRIASVSEIFTCAAIDRLIQAGALTSTMQAFGFLGITSKLLLSQTPDPDVDKITMHDLAMRQSGLQHDFGADLRTIATRIGHPTVMPTRDDLVRYIYGEPLIARPGTGDNYSNSAFTVLTSVVEAASNLPYLDYLRRELLMPLNIHDVDLGATRSGVRRPHEVATYDHPGVGPSQIDMTATAIAPNAYGAQVITENSEGVGGLVASTGSIARFIATHAVWDMGPRQLATRYGEMDGSGAGAVSRHDGLDFAYAFNRRVTTAEHDGIKGQIDLFLDQHGIML
ncbi:serine hydrolase [Methylobacter marinus]|uniref:serine hydrolase n=1 Tax=Methylobacter marinus TaxID=34058 RepID=UPI000364760F|nr:serine hydrolase [Methylobacter marinus]